MSIHESIKMRRTALGWSHQRLADEVSALEGLTKPLAWQTVQQWENTTSAPKRRRLEFVAQALGCRLDELLGAVVPKSASTSAPDSLGLQPAQAQLLQFFDVLPPTEQAELVDEAHRRAAKVLGERFLAERFGVKGYATDARVIASFGAAPAAQDAEDRRKK